MPSEPRIYDVLVLPNEALEKGGIEVLRAGLIENELYVTARRVFTDPAAWGEVLADIARRLALLHSAEGEFDEAEVLAAIESAFAADLGAPLIKDAMPRPARKRPRKRATPAKKPARRRTPTRTKSRTSSRAKSAKRSKR